MRRKLLALLAVALLSAAACGDSAENDDAESPPRGGEDTAAQAVEVRATDFAFDPDVIETEPGETIDVTFVNAGNVSHSFTIEELDFDHEAPSGAEVKAALDVPDEDTTLEYICRFHPSEMKGELVVGDGGSGSGGGGGGGGGSESDEFDY